jgi:putative ubiquitin-RnfH superfamily antitoxin RatB of RatAB toxin-antitoxin module
MTDAALLTVEVVYALPWQQRLATLQVEPGTTALQAVERSGLLIEFPELVPAEVRMGIFSRVLDGSLLPTPDRYVLQQGDRVEIYRPLMADPKAARQQRAAKMRSDSARSDQAKSDQAKSDQVRADSAKG